MGARLTNAFPVSLSRGEGMKIGFILVDSDSSIYASIAESNVLIHYLMRILNIRHGPNIKDVLLVQL